MQNRTAALIRCQAINKSERLLEERLSQAFENVFFVVHSQTVGGDLPENAIAINENILVDMDLHYPKNWGWLCGDYFYYAAAARLAGFESYWLLEPDVMFDFDDVPAFFSCFESDTSDFLAAYYWKRDNGWYHERAARDYFNEVYGCIFPITRMSLRFIKAALQARCDYGKVWSKAGGAYINDEAFIASLANRLSFQCNSIEALAPEYISPNLLQTARLFPKELMDGKTGKLIHPAVDAEEFARRLEKKLHGNRADDGVISYYEDVVEALNDPKSMEILRNFKAKNGMRRDEMIGCQKTWITTFIHRGRMIEFVSMDPGDVIQSQHMAGAFYESEELEIIEAHFKGGVFVDIGANIGNHTVFVSKYLGAERIIVIEPNPKAIYMLKKNIAINNLENVDTQFLGLGLGAKPDRAVIVTPEHNLGGAKLKRPEDSAGSIKVVTGDSLLSETRVDFLKIDVERMDMLVLSGLKRTIDKHRPTIFIEVESYNEKRFKEWCHTNGYRIVKRFKRYDVNENFLVEPI